MVFNFPSMQNNPVSYWFREAWRALKSPKQGLGAAVLTIGLCSFVLGVLGWVADAAWKALPSPDEAHELQVYVQPDYESKTRLESIEQSLKELNQLEDLEFCSKDEAWQLFMREFPSHMAEALDSNPLPPSFILSLKKEFHTTAAMEKVREVVSNIKGIESVSPVSPYLKWIESWRLPVQMTGLFLFVMVGLAFISVMANSIQISLLSRRDVVENALVLGAGFWMLAMPFVIEGCIIGVIGGTLGTAVAVSIIQLLRSIFPLTPSIHPYLSLGIPAVSLVLAGFTSLFTVWRFIYFKNNR